jgi:hypothetical protein
VSRGWLSLSGIGGRGSVAAGLVAAVYIFSGWDGTVYVNEEVRHRRTNPGRAAILAVALLTVIYTFAQMGLQGAVSPARLQQHSSDALVYVAQALGGGGWAKVMALALALSVIAATGTSIVLTARIIYGMASRRVLPGFLATVSPRFATPVAASVVTGLLITGLTWVYLLASSVQDAFNEVVDESGQLFAVFYILTALATVAYYRRRILASAWDGLILGLLPLGAAGFLGWILARYLQSAPASQIWSRECDSDPCSVCPKIIPAWPVRTRSARFCPARRSRPGRGTAREQATLRPPGNRDLFNWVSAIPVAAMALTASVTMLAVLVAASAVLVPRAERDRVQCSDHDHTPTRCRAGSSRPSALSPCQLARLARLPARRPMFAIRRWTRARGQSLEDLSGQSGRSSWH